MLVTAQDGVTTKSYSIVVSRTGSNNASLSAISLTPATTLTKVSGTNNYIASVAYTVASVTVKPVTSDANATVTVNGSAVVSGSQSAAIPLNVGSNIITTIVTAQDGVTTRAYLITITRATGALSLANNISRSFTAANPADSLQITNDDIVVYPGLSPNGDGINDVFTIDGLNDYPDNKVTIINRNGVVVYEAKGYDNSTKVFDGHSNINGTMQLPGTYFYSLDYSVNGINKHKTGFIILKY
jgi:gliding motility-associated-like protein